MKIVHTYFYIFKNIKFKKLEKYFNNLIIFFLLEFRLLIGIL